MKYEKSAREYSTDNRPPVGGPLYTGLILHVDISHKMLPLTFAISDDYLIFGDNTVNRCEQLLPEAQAI